MAAVTGCSGDGETGDTTTDNETATDGKRMTTSTETGTAPTATTTETTTDSAMMTKAKTKTNTRTTASGTGIAEITSRDFDIIEDHIIYGAAMTATVKNTSNERLSYIKVTATFYDDAGDVVETNYTELSGLAPGRTWAAYIPYGGEPTDIANGELEITDAAVGELPSPPDSAKLLESGLIQPANEYTEVAVAGHVRNTGNDPIDLGTYVVFYTDDGTVLNDGSTNTTDILAGETWRFEVDFMSWAPEAYARVAEYDVTLTEYRPSASGS